MNKKNKKKGENSDAVLEGILELIFMIVFSTIGFIVCLGISKIFSLKMDNFDLDSFALIGIIFVIVMTVVVEIIKKIIKKIKEKNK